MTPSPAFRLAVRTVNRLAQAHHRFTGTNRPLHDWLRRWTTDGSVVQLLTRGTDLPYTDSCTPSVHPAVHRWTTDRLYTCCTPLDHRHWTPAVHCCPSVHWTPSVHCCPSVHCGTLRGSLPSVVHSVVQTSLAQTVPTDQRQPERTPTDVLTCCTPP